MQGFDHRNGGFGGSSSSSDGKHHFGVRSRRFIVEIKNWYEGVSFHRTVKTSLEEADMMHDLARMYSDPTVDEKRLNTPMVGFMLEKEYPALASSGQPLNIGKNFLIYFVEKYPIMRVGNNSKERAASMTREIVRLTPLALEELKDWIAPEQSGRAGRQRTDLDEIHPVVQEDGLLELSKENQHLKATIIAKDEALKEKDEAIIALKEELHAARVRAAKVTPFKRGFAEREGILQKDLDSDPVSASEWMDMCLNYTNIAIHHPTG